MNILEVPEGNTITIIVHLGAEKREFYTVACQTLANTLLIEEIVDENGEPLSLAAPGLQIEAVTIGTNGKPIIWHHVIVRHITYKGKNYHRVAQLEDGKATNRRSCFRLDIGKPAVLSKGINRPAINVLMRDVSIHGFSFVTAEELEVSPNNLVHITCNMPDYTIQQTGFIVRKLPVAPNYDRYIYGCYVTVSDRNLDNWIVKQERENLKNRSLNR